MAHYAFINSNNVVVEVITGVDETETQTDFDGTIVGGSTEAWENFYQTKRQGLVCKRTSYNAKGDGFRGRYAAIGYSYNPEADVFVEPSPHAGWVLDSNFNWQPPFPKPNDGKKYIWIDELVNWQELPWIDQLDDAGNNP